MKHRPKIITDGRNGDFGRQCSGPIAKKAAFWGRWVAMFRPRRRKTASGAGVGGNGPALKRGRGLARPHTRLYCMVYLLVWVVYPRPNWVVFTGGSGWLCSGVGIHHYVAYKDMIIHLWAETSIVLQLDVDTVEYEWKY